MKIKIQIAIASHISDAQDAINFGLGYKKINNHLNFAKALLVRYPNTEVEVEENELNDLWREIAE